MARSKQTYYGSCFVASYIYKVTIEKKWTHSLQKGPIKFQWHGPMGPYLIIPRKYPGVMIGDIVVNSCSWWRCPDNVILSTGFLLVMRAPFDYSMHCITFESHSEWYPVAFRSCPHPSGCRRNAQQYVSVSWAAMAPRLPRWLPTPVVRSDVQGGRWRQLHHLQSLGDGRWGWVRHRHCHWAAATDQLLTRTLCHQQSTTWSC